MKYQISWNSANEISEIATMLGSTYRLLMYLRDGMAASDLNDCNARAIDPVVEVLEGLEKRLIQIRDESEQDMAAQKEALCAVDPIQELTDEEMARRRELYKNAPAAYAAKYGKYK